jgi:hypothetical protein
MAELEADPAYRQRIAERDAAHRQRVAENADEFALVRQALDDAGLPSEDFGRFTSGRYPDVIRPSVFDTEERFRSCWRFSRGSRGRWSRKQ